MVAHSVPSTEKFVVLSKKMSQIFNKTQITNFREIQNVNTFVNWTVYILQLIYILTQREKAQ